MLVANGLEESLEDYGFDVVRTSDRLEALMAVQNTYLSTFQSLGGLGLLLGTFGLAAVQLRNVFERRGELALMRAAGFPTRRSTLRRLVLLENGALLIGGPAVGTRCALVVILPHWLPAATRRRSPASTLTLDAVGRLFMPLASWIAVRAMLASPIVAALQGEWSRGRYSFGTQNRR